MKQSKDAQILELSATVETFKNKVAELEQKLKNSESTKDSWYKSMNEKQAQLDSIHDLFDVLPDPVPRKTGTDEMASYERKDRSVMERLVAYLVRRA